MVILFLTEKVMERLVTVYQASRPSAGLGAEQGPGKGHCADFSQRPPRDPDRWLKMAAVILILGSGVGIGSKRAFWKSHPQPWVSCPHLLGLA